MIEVNGLTKRFGDFTAVKDVSFRVGEGEILALLGPNGAGKTTTVRMLASILQPTSGSARVGGMDVVAEAREVRHFVGMLTELPGLYSRMKPLAYLDFFGELEGVPRSLRLERSRELLTLFGLWEYRHLPLGHFSKGMRQKMALSRALIHSPKVLYLDEPTSALDPAGAKLVRDYIVSLGRAGHTAVVCTHNLAEAEALADKMAVIKEGQIVAFGYPQDLRKKLLGPPLFELQMVSLDGYLPLIQGLVKLESRQGDRVCFRALEPQKQNPLLLQRLVEAGAEVVSLSEVPYSLESVYLRIVENSSSGSS
ncbi:MAG: ABC transporter ATP-binding protein [Chloroflexota bacterium]